MKSSKNLFFIACTLFAVTSLAQTNFTASLAVNQEVRTMYGPICCYYRVNIATDDDGNVYVLSQIPSDSSIWVSKYNENGVQQFNTRVGVAGFETNYRYFAKKIRVYDDIIYVLSTTIFDAAAGERQTIYTINKNTGALQSTLGFFEAGTGYVTELVDLVRSGNTIFLAGNTRNAVSGGPGSQKIMVMVTDLNFSGPVYTSLGNVPSTDYLINTESNAVAVHNGSLYMTGQAVGPSNPNIFLAKIRSDGTWTEFISSSSSFPLGGKGLNLVAENNFIYLSGSLRASLKQPFRTAVIKMDTSLVSPTWITTSKSSEWPLGISLTSGNLIYTIDYAFKVVGFSKSTGQQLFAKNDFKNYTQVYNQPVYFSTLNNDQLVIQGTMGIKVSGKNTTTKIVAKYSTSGSRTYLQAEPVSTVGSGQTGFAEALGLAYAPSSDYLYELFRKNSAAGQLVYLTGKTSPTALRIASEQPVVPGLILYPNPADKYIRIEAEENILSWVIFNSLSQFVAGGKVDVKELEWECGSVDAGIYFLKATTASGNTLVKRFIISRE